MVVEYKSLITQILLDIGLNQKVAESLGSVADFITIVLFSILFYYLSKFVILKLITKFSKKTKSNWDDALLKFGFFRRLILLIPAIIILNSLEPTLYEFKGILNLFTRLTVIGIVLIFNSLIIRFFKSAQYVLQEKKGKSDPAIQNVFQVLKFIIVAICVIIIISIFFNVKPGKILGYLSALSAVTMLVFKDTILGFVGGMQLAVNDMVSIGDWIVVNGKNVDGNVEDISLMSVKVRNFDNTIITLPTYNLVSDAFQNYKGMEESGVRRVLRSVYIDISSIKFCTEKDLEKYREISLIRDYINQKQSEIESYNKENHKEDKLPVNGRTQTNIGIFRAYMTEYIMQNPNISEDNTRLVRMLQPTDRGVPLEIYAFIKYTDTVGYNKVLSDIFDHILASASFFDLKIYQSPTGDDVKSNIAAMDF